MGLVSEIVIKGLSLGGCVLLWSNKLHSAHSCVPCDCDGSGGGGVGVL